MVLTMIITEMLPYGMIKSQLKSTDKISIVSCNSCARMCETGGKEAMDKLAKRLEKEKFNVVEKELIGAACDIDQVKKIKYKGNTIIVLACDAGVYNLKKLLPKKKVISALDTIGLGAWDEKGNLNLIKKFE